MRALVVNTGSFKCRYLMRHPGLHGADCDALALHLRHPHLGALPEGAVTRVVDPIRSELIAAFTDLAAAVRDAHRDVVLVYVAGPALRVAKRGKQKGSYLVLRDTELKRDAGRFAASALSAADLGALLASIPCRQRLCLLDMVPEVSDGARRGAGGGDAAPATPDDADAAAVASEAEKEAESSAAGATTVTGEASGTGDGGAAPVANTAAPAPAPARSRSLRGMLGKRKRASDFRPRSLRQLPRGVQFVPGTDCYTAVYEASLGAHVVGACKLPSAVAPSKQRESQVRLMGVAQSMWARRLMLALSPAGEGDEHCAADPAGAITLHDAVAHLLAQLPRDAEERARDMAGRVVDKKRADRERESAAAGGDEGADEGGGGDEETPEEREKRREERRAKAEKEEEATRHKMEKAFFRALTPVYEGPGFETRLEAIVVARSGAAAQPRDRGVLSRLRGATAQSVGGRFLQSAARTASAVAQRVQEARGGGNGADNAPEKGFDLLVFPANTVAAVAPALRVPREAIAPPRQAVAGLDEGNALGLAAEREGGKKRDADPPRLALALDDSGGPAAGSRVSVELPFTAFLHPLPRACALPVTASPPLTHTPPLTIRATAAAGGPTPRSRHSLLDHPRGTVPLHACPLTRTDDALKCPLHTFVITLLLLLLAPRSGSRHRSPGAPPWTLSCSCAARAGLWPTGMPTRGVSSPCPAAASRSSPQVSVSSSASAHATWAAAGPSASRRRGWRRAAVCPLPPAIDPTHTSLTPRHSTFLSPAHCAAVNVTSPRDRLAWLAREGTFWNVLEFLREKRNDADAAHWACRQLIARMRQGHRACGPRPVHNRLCVCVTPKQLACCDYNRLLIAPSLIAPLCHSCPHATPHRPATGIAGPAELRHRRVRCRDGAPARVVAAPVFLPPPRRVRAIPG